MSADNYLSWWFDIKIHIFIHEIDSKCICMWTSEVSLMSVYNSPVTVSSANGFEKF